LKPFTQSHGQLHAQRHHARLGYLEAKINENVATAGNHSRVGETGIAPAT
jgi:hypothetical protein